MTPQINEARSTPRVEKWRAKMRLWASTAQRYMPWGEIVDTRKTIHASLRSAKSPDEFRAMENLLARLDAMLQTETT